MVLFTDIWKLSCTLLLILLLATSNLQESEAFLLASSNTHRQKASGLLVHNHHNQNHHHRQQRSHQRQSQFSIYATETRSEDRQQQEGLSLWTLEELESHVDRAGIIISFTTLGPGFRAVARAKHNETLIIGYVEGFVRPSGQILHLDKMEVFKSMVKRAREEEPDIDFGGVSFAIGLVLGYRCLLHGIEKGCTTAEFLAIDDEEFQHKRLVKYYKQVGFKVVKYVGEAIQDIPDRMIWGGCGTLMREDIKVLLEKFSKKLHLMKNRSKK